MRDARFHIQCRSFPSAAAYFGARAFRPIKGQRAIRTKERTPPRGRRRLLEREMSVMAIFFFRDTRAQTSTAPAQILENYHVGPSRHCIVVPRDNGATWGRAITTNCLACSCAEGGRGHRGKHAMTAHDDTGDEKIKRAAPQYHNAARLASIMRRPRIARRPRAPERKRRTETVPFETRHLSGRITACRPRVSRAA